jgi:hypothetical protein
MLRHQGCLTIVDFELGLNCSVLQSGHLLAKIIAQSKYKVTTYAQEEC